MHAITSNLTLIIPEENTKNKMVAFGLRLHQPYMNTYKADEGASRKLPFYSLCFLNNIFRNYESKAIIHHYLHHVSQNRASKHSKPMRIPLIYSLKQHIT